MSELVNRGEILFEKGRWLQALEVFLECLAEEPEDGHVLTYVSRCYLHLESFTKATEAADSAIAVNPNDSYAHYVKAFVFFARNLDEDASRALDVALELEPTNSDYYVLLGQIKGREADWLGVQDTMDRALEFDPEHTGALIVKADALVHLRQFDLAVYALESVLEKEPENEDALTGLGTLYLHQSEWKQALESFQGALSLNPELEQAREGFMQAMRAQFPVYGLVLRYFLWMNRFSKKYQQLLVYGLSALAKLLGVVKKEYPALAPLLGVFLVVWRLFSYLTWTIRAVTTLLLRGNKYGRSLVKQEEIVESNLVGGLWLGALCCWLYLEFVDPFSLFCKVGIPICLTLPLVVAGSLGTVTYGWPKYIARALLGLMLFAGLGGLVLFTAGFPLGLTLLMFYFKSFSFILLILAYLEGVRPERD